MFLKLPILLYGEKKSTEEKTVMHEIMYIEHSRIDAMYPEFNGNLEPVYTRIILFSGRELVTSASINHVRRMLANAQRVDLVSVQFCIS